MIIFFLIFFNFQTLCQSPPDQSFKKKILEIKSIENLQPYGKYRLEKIIDSVYRVDGNKILAIYSYHQLAKLEIKESFLDESNEHLTLANELLEKNLIQDTFLVFNQKLLEAHLSYRKGLFSLAIDKSKESFSSVEVNRLLGLCFWRLNQFDSAKRYFKKNIRINTQLNDSISLARAIEDLGLIYGKKGELDSAELLFLKALSIYEASENKELEKKIAYTYNYLGVVNMKAERNDIALRYLNKSLEIRRKFLPKDHLDLAHNYNNIGGVYQQLNQLYEAIEYHKKALKIRIAKYGENHWEVAKSLTNIGVCYKELANYAEAEKYLNNAYDIKKHVFGEDHLETYMTLNGLLGCKIKKGDIKTSEKYLNSIESGLKNHFPEERIILTHMKERRVEIEKKKGNFYKSINILKSLIESHKSDDLLNGKLGRIYNEMGNLYDSLNEHNLAIAYYDSALFLQKTEAINIGDLYLSYFYKAQSHYHFFKKNKETNSLNMSVHSFLLADSCYQILYDDLSFTDKINGKRIEVYRSAIAALYDYNEIKSDSISRELLYYFFNRKGSKLVRELFQKRKIFAEETDSLFIKENKLNDEIFNLRLKISKAQENTEDLEDILFDKLLELERLKSIIKKTRPSYFKFKYNQPESKLHTTQHALGNNYSLINYSIHDGKIYVLIIQKNKFITMKWRIPANFFSDLNSIITKLSNPTFDFFDKEIIDFERLSHKLYLSLISPLEGEIKNTKLIINRDTRLLGIPFEILVQSIGVKKSFRNLNYMVKDYEISYSLSNEFSQVENKKVGKSGIFALTFEDKNSHDFTPLPNTFTEAHKIVKYLKKADIYLNDQADEPSFWKVISQVGKIHISSHSFVNEEDPFLSHIHLYKGGQDKHDGIIHGFELINKNLKLDLAVLNACQTGGSKLYKNEGMISLAAGFLIGGTKEVMCTSWNVSDQATILFIELFYKHLEDEKTAKSLQQAKLGFLDKTPYEVFTHPHYWANYSILTIGPQEPEDDRIWIVLTSIFLVLLVLFFIKKYFDW